MQNCCAGVSKPVMPASRYDHRLTRRYRFVLVLDPDFGLPFQNGQHLFNGMEMRRRSAPGLAPLLENAQLRCTSDSRHPHASHYAGTPLFP